MRFLRQYRYTVIHATASVVVVLLLGAADYYGFAVFGETAEQQKPDHQTHIYQRFHK